VWFIEITFFEDFNKKNFEPSMVIHTCNPIYSGIGKEDQTRLGKVSKTLSQKQDANKRARMWLEC
jgi:hypothetical protein